jgi:hypothetical protein
VSCVARNLFYSFFNSYSLKEPTQTPQNTRGHTIDGVLPQVPAYLHVAIIGRHKTYWRVGHQVDPTNSMADCRCKLNFWSPLLSGSVHSSSVDCARREPYLDVGQFEDRQTDV